LSTAPAPAWIPHPSDSGIIENIGTPLAFEEPYWAGDRPAVIDHGGDRPYPFPFHPLELGEGALRALFGFASEGPCLDDDPDLDRIVLAGFAVRPPTDG
jgi:hypothetical protein